MAYASPSSTRPRRSTRPPAKYAVQQDPPPSLATAPSRQKRKTDEPNDAFVVEHVDQLHFLLTNPRSALTTIDISDILNAGAWHALSDDARATLSTLLPPTAFPSYVPTVDPSHPSQPSVSPPPTSSHNPSLDPDPDPSIFTSPHFLAATRTFQDHIVSGWRTDTNALLVKNYIQGVRDGTMHAPWKDEVWARDNPPEVSGSTNAEHVESNATRVRVSADSSDKPITLSEIAKHGLLRTGDILVYKRAFPHLGSGLVVEKDLLVHAIHPKTHLPTLLTSPSTSIFLPSNLVSHSPDPPSPPTLTLIPTCTTPAQIEDALLNIDGRVPRADRHRVSKTGVVQSADAGLRSWKSLSLWRWRDGARVDGMAVDIGLGEGQDAERGERENHGTLFYLRGSFYDR